MPTETLSGLPSTNAAMPITFIGQPPGPGASSRDIVAYNDAKWNWQNMNGIIQDYLARAANAKNEYDRTGAASAKSAMDDWNAKAQENIQSLQKYAQTGDVAKFFQPVSPTAPSSGGSSSIPFKQGLTPAQQQSIQNLVTNKPPNQWNATDKANWAYATNNAPVPVSGAQTPTGTAQQPPAAPAAPQGQPAGVSRPSQVGGLQFYRVGQDIFDASTGRKLGPTEWNATWSGKASEVPAPSTAGQPAGGAGTSGTSTAGPGTTAPSLDDQRKKLADSGIDVTGLNDQQVGYLAAFKSMMDTKAQSDQAVLPKQLTADEMAKFMDQAKTEMDPYYAEQLRIGQKDLLDNFAQITQDTQYQSQQRQQQIQDEQKAQADQMAEAGLTYSGIRQEAQRKLQEQEQGIVRSESSAIARKLREQAGQFEKTYGSQALSQLNIPALTYAGVQVKPYDAYGGLLGTQGKEKITTETQRQQELAQQELSKRFGLAGFSTTTP